MDDYGTMQFLDYYEASYADDGSIFGIYTEYGSMVEKCQYRANESRRAIKVYEVFKAGWKHEMKTFTPN